MDKIGQGKYVELAYDVYRVGQNGDEIVVSVDPHRPDGFVYGEVQGMVDGFVRGIAGLKAGDKFKFTVEPGDAFGQVNPDMIIDLDKSVFNVDGKFDDKNIVEGATVPMNTQSGQRVYGTAKKIGSDKVTLDFNHPLAGERVKYVGTVLTVRDATDADRAPKHCCVKGHCGKHEGNDGGSCHCNDCGNE